MLIHQPLNLVVTIGVIVVVVVSSRKARNKPTGDVLWVDNDDFRCDYCYARFGRVCEIPGLKTAKVGPRNVRTRGFHYPLGRIFRHNFRTSDKPIFDYKSLRATKKLG